MEIGKHIIMDFFGCPFSFGNSEEKLKEVIRKSVQEAGYKLLDVRSYRFTPQGVTAFGVIAESHIALHSWPEHDYLGLDFFTCNTKVDFNKLVKYIIKLVPHKKVKYRIIGRG